MRFISAYVDYKSGNRHKSSKYVKYETLADMQSVYGGDLIG